MNPQLLPAPLDSDTPPWTQTVMAFLAEKERRSGSTRTVESYARMLWPFFDRVGSPDQVTPAHVLAWAHGIGASGREPSSATVGARIACLSSYYRFLIRMNIATANPCDALERPRTVQSVARGLSADEVRRLLAVVPDTVAGRRDRALLLVFVLTGRRRAEVLGLTAGDISVEGDTAYYRYRGKGGKRGRRELPQPAYEALRATLADAGLVLEAMAPSASLWQAGAGPRGHHELDLLRPLPPLPPGGRAPADRTPRPAAYRGEATPGCGRLDRGGQLVPRPLELGGHVGLPAAT